MQTLAYLRLHWATHRTHWIIGILVFSVSLLLGVGLGVLSW